MAHDEDLITALCPPDLSFHDDPDPDATLARMTPYVCGGDMYNDSGEQDYTGTIPTNGPRGGSDILEFPEVVDHGAGDEGDNSLRPPAASTPMATVPMATVPMATVRFASSFAEPGTPVELGSLTHGAFELGSLRRRRSLSTPVPKSLSGVSVSEGSSRNSGVSVPEGSGLAEEPFKRANVTSREFAAAADGQPALRNRGVSVPRQINRPPPLFSDSSDISLESGAAAAALVTMAVANRNNSDASSVGKRRRRSSTGGKFTPQLEKVSERGAASVSPLFDPDLCGSHAPITTPSSAVPAPPGIDDRSLSVGSRLSGLSSGESFRSARSVGSFVVSPEDQSFANSCRANQQDSSFMSGIEHEDTSSEASTVRRDSTSAIPDPDLYDSSSSDSSKEYEERYRDMQNTLLEKGPSDTDSRDPDADFLDLTAVKSRRRSLTSLGSGRDKVRRGTAAMSVPRALSEQPASPRPLTLANLRQLSKNEARTPTTASVSHTLT